MYSSDVIFSASFDPNVRFDKNGSISAAKKVQQRKCSKEAIITVLLVGKLAIKNSKKFLISLQEQRTT